MTQAVSATSPGQLTGPIFSALITAATGTSTAIPILHGLAFAPSKYWITPIGASTTAAAVAVIYTVDSTTITCYVTTGDGALVMWQL